MTAPQTVADVQALDVLYNEGSDSIVLADPVNHDDVAEVFHNERHTVTQTVEQALALAHKFAAADRLYHALQSLLVVAGTPITDRQAAIFEEARAALREAATSARQGETK